MARDTRTSLVKSDSYEEKCIKVCLRVNAYFFAAGLTLNEFDKLEKVFFYNKFN